MTRYKFRTQEPQHLPSHKILYFCPSRMRIEKCAFSMFMTDFTFRLPHCTLLYHLILTGILMVFTLNYKKEPSMLQQKTLSVDFSEILWGFVIFWWRQRKYDDVSNFFLSTFQVKHPVWGRILWIKWRRKIRINVIYLSYLYRI